MIYFFLNLRAMHSHHHLPSYDAVQAKSFHPPTSRATANLLPTILLPSTTRTPRLPLYQSSSISCSYPAETAVSPSTAVIVYLSARARSYLAFIRLPPARAQTISPSLDRR